MCSPLLITGGTGSLGQALASLLLRDSLIDLFILSRNESLQWSMSQRYPSTVYPVYYTPADVTDIITLGCPFADVHTVIHAAAYKHVLRGELNPGAYIDVNITGTRNVIRAAKFSGVRRVLGISTDKAVRPINHYGATKLVADGLLLGANQDGPTKFSVIRFGNFADSSGSVMQVFRRYAREERASVPIHDRRMTRFHVTLAQAAKLTFKALELMQGGEIFVPKLPTYRLENLAREMCPKAKIYEIGADPGEKIHEDLIMLEDAHLTREFGEFYITYPFWFQGDKLGTPVLEGFSYSSGG